MKFDFICELCKKEIMQGNHFNLDVFQKEDATHGNGHECLDDVCESCIDKITQKIYSLKK